jgi:uncharacterized repeat protein (TIGR02543 family)
MKFNPNKSLFLLTSRTARLLTLLLLLALPAVVQAQSGSGDGYDYSINTGGTTITITDYTGPGGVVTIPTRINNLLVTSIGDSAFYDCYNLASVTIPNIVTSIGEWAFYDCSGLTNAMIGNGVTSIGLEAFEGCSGLTSVTIPNSVNSIGELAFRDCTSLTAITVDAENPAYSSVNGVLFDQTQSMLIQYPGGLRGSYAIPGSVTSIELEAFEGCSGLTSVTIPGSVTSIGEEAFYDCTGLTNAMIGNGVTSIGDDVFEYCSGLTSVTIPNSVNSIGASAFECCTSLTSVTIPYSVNSIGANAFEYCTSLTSVTIGSDQVFFEASIGDYAFYDCYKLASVTISGSVTGIGDFAFYDCTSLISVYFQGNAPTIGLDVFSGDNNATVYYLPCAGGWSSPFAGLHAMPWWQLLLNCTTNAGAITITGYSGSSGNWGSCSTVIIPATINGLTVTSIGDNAFENSVLTSITIPGSVTNIGEDAFWCNRLTNITVSTNNPAYSSVNGVLFDQTQSMLIQYPGGLGGSYTVPDSVTSIGEDAFAFCTTLTSVTIPNSVTNIGEGAFAFCTTLTSVTIPNSVNSIGASAFEYCMSLANVTIPNYLASIGEGAFEFCTTLASVTIPASVTNIGEEAFSGCTSLTSVTIPASVTNIGEEAFSGCTSLTSVTIPASVTSIGEDAFFECSSLTSVYFEGSAPSADSFVFYGDNNATVYYLTGTTGWGSMFAGLPTVALYTVTVSASPVNGGTVSFGVTNEPGSTITLTATNNSGYVFTGWTSNGTPAVSSTNYTFTLSTNVTLVANFLPLYTVSVSALPANGGTVSFGVTNEPGSTITVTATNNSGYVFTGWTSNGIPVVSTTNYTFTLNTNVTLFANFLPSLTVALNNSPANGGTVSGGGTFASNSTVTVTATAADGYVLTNWTQGLSTNVTSTSSNYIFTLTSNVTLVANFVLSPPHIEVFNVTNAITNNQMAPVNFGSVEQGKTGPTITFTVTNTGGLPLTLTNITVPLGYTLNTNPPLTITNFPFTIAGVTNGMISAGTFSVQLNSSNIGTYPGSINITNNVPITNTFSFPITGIVTAVPSVMVSVIALPADGGTVSVGGTIGGGLFPVGSTNAVLATANSGFEFIGWTGDATGTENPLMVTVNTNLNITANFAIITNYILTVITNGEGKVTPNPNGKLFKANSTHTLTATAASGNVFSNWTGSITTNKNPLTIKLVSSMVLQANFVTNPFLPFVGTYNGLFWSTNGIVAETNAGMLKGLTLTSKGTYSGSLLINGASKGFSGSFDVAGVASKSISLGSKEGDVGVVMTLTSNNPAPQVTGTVSNACWLATNLIADRATNALPSAEYTLLIPPDTNNTSSPIGYGYALITGSEGTAKTPATVKITGALADGTAFSQSVPVSLDGYVPIYANLYSGKGLLLGWINLTNASGVSLAWVHPTVRSGLFTGAFTSTNQIALSPWTNPPANSALPTNLVVVETTVNNPVQTNDFIITITNGTLDFGKLSGPATPLNGSIAPKTGLLKVTFGSGASKTTGYGVILLNGTNGGGYFLTKTNAGAVILEP